MVIVHLDKPWEHSATNPCSRPFGAMWKSRLRHTYIAALTRLRSSCRAKLFLVLLGEHLISDHMHKAIFRHPAVLDLLPPLLDMIVHPWKDDGAAIRVFIVDGDRALDHI